MSQSSHQDQKHVQKEHLTTVYHRRNDISAVLKQYVVRAAAEIARNSYICNQIPPDSQSNVTRGKSNAFKSSVRLKRPD